jgi:deazaflavin-dependent oxidoreductase (nitroreductase family)
MTDTLYGKQHIDRYLATDGEEGYRWRKGTEILLLFTRGRKSGQEHIHPLIFREVDGRYLIVASMGGADKSPQWYLNLQADPDVAIQIRGDRFRVTARDAGPDEKARYWQAMTEVWPDYDAYQKKTEREIPVVVLERP